jgi:hypothetical protein
MRIIVLSFFLLRVCLLHGQQKDSAVRKYFVCESKFDNRIRTFEEGKRIFVKDTFATKFRGILTVINDSLIEVHNKWTRARDTFSMKEIYKVRRPSKATTWTTVFLTTSGVTLIYYGNYLMSEGDILSVIGGFLIFELGILNTMIGPVIVNGGVGSYSNDYKFTTVTTIGVKFKRKFKKAV